MGAWGIHSFDNDDAADLLALLADADQPYQRAEAVREVFEAVFEVEASDLDAATGAAAVGGAEVIAAALGRPREGDEVDPLELRESFRFYEDSVGMALAALHQVRTDGSELVELWDDTDEADEWRKSVSDLDARLRKAAEAHDLSVDFTPPPVGSPPDALQRSENQQISQDILEEFQAELEKLADRNKGDPSVEVLRQLGRRIFRMHIDITNLHYAVTGSIDALAERISKLEQSAK